MIKRGNLTIYEQIKKDIVGKIEDGEYESGQCLPSERSMETIYSASRVTVRRAIEELEKDGILERRQGAGTFVKKFKTPKSSSALCGILEEFAERNIEITCQVTTCDYIDYRGEIAEIWEKLEVEKTERVYFVERLMLAEGCPILIEKNFFPVEIGREFENFNMSKDIIYKGLDMIGYGVNHASQEIFARMAKEEEKRLLRKNEDFAALVFDRVNYSVTGEVILYAEAVYTNDKYKYNMYLKRYI
ncbi:MAG: GntR family transcriptional regulator [Eubacteriales bacterium]